jgi:alpha-glucosidase
LRGGELRVTHQARPARVLWATLPGQAFVAAAQGIGRGAQPITLAAHLQAGAGGSWHTSYASVPHYVTGQLRSLFLTSYEYAVFDLRRGDRVQIQLFAAELPGRILHGDSPVDLIAEYTAYAGRMRPLPDWIGEGAIVGIQGGATSVQRALERLQSHGTPVAAIWLQDWVGQRRTSFGTQLWWNWELDQEHYTSWDVLRTELDAHGVRLLTYINPYVVDVSDKARYQRDLFREAAEAGYLIRDARGEPYRTRITDFWASLVDLTNPSAWAWLKEVILEQVVAVGAAGWMADFGEGLPYDAQLRAIGQRQTPRCTPTRKRWRTLAASPVCTRRGPSTAASSSTWPQRRVCQSCGTRSSTTPTTAMSTRYHISFTTLTPLLTVSTD